MTESSNEPSDPKLDDAASGLPAAEGSNSEAADDAALQAGPPDEGLPEWEPLTPELVEDEAIRGDFVIRWVVVGLALLLGISQIAETRTLVHVKNGIYLLNHGVLPGSKDVFSYTANDRKWVNLPWLFDILSGAVYSLGGGIGLSIVQGLLAALTFGLLSHAVRPSIRTWWGSLCAVLALLTCYLQFTVQPELITLLGVSFVLWLLVHAEETSQPQRLWLLVPAIWVWAQLDSRAWFGWFLLLLWLAGEWLSGQTTAYRQKSPLGKVTLFSLVAVAIHPFLWESWLAPMRLYLTDYPAVRAAYQGSTFVDPANYPIWKPLIWTSLTHRTVAALVLFAATIVSMFLNRSKVLWSHLYAFIGFNCLSLFATHEFAAASLVNCVLCTINAQQFYRDRIGQVYSIDWRELLFSRGGRAVTVLGFFALAWTILSGRLDGPGGKRTGVGFEPHLASAMSEYEKLATDVVDDRPFNFSMRQGDLMIWAGLKPFLDTRSALYFSTDGANLLALHDKTRRALRRKRDLVQGSGEPTVWKETFDKYQISQAWPRLNGPVPPPDYPSFVDLLSSSDFTLTEVNSATAVFLRKDRPDPQLTAYADQHAFDFVRAAFRTKPPKAIDLTREWAKPASTYDNLFALRRPSAPAGVQAGQHFIEVPSLVGGVPNSQIAACAVLAIRHANEGLHEDANSAEGYQVLGRSYSILGQLESMILSQGGKNNIPSRMRYSQAVAALHQAISLQPNDIGSILLLIEHYQQMGRIDSQLDLRKKLISLQPRSKALTMEQRQEREQVTRLEEAVAEIDGRISKALDDGADRMQVAVGAYQLGGLLRAITTLEEDAIYLEKNPQAKLLLGGWLNEAGRGRDAAAVFESVEGIASDHGIPGWREAVAFSAINVANYARTIELWKSQLRDTSSAQVPQALYTLPFLTLNPLWTPDAYPLTHLGAATQIIQGVRFEGSNLLYHIALAQMESGEIEDAAKSIKQAIDLHPDSALRPILRFYLECLTGEQIEETAPVTPVEEFLDLVEAETEATDKK